MRQSFFNAKCFYGWSLIGRGALVSKKKSIVFSQLPCIYVILPPLFSGALDLHDFVKKQVIFQQFSEKNYVISIRIVIVIDTSLTNLQTQSRNLTISAVIRIPVHI